MNSTAERFLSCLPLYVPLPEVSDEPDGDVSLEWYVSKRRVFSISIGLSKNLMCAWLCDDDSGNMVVEFNGSDVPESVLCKVLMIFNEGEI